MTRSTGHLILAGNSIGHPEDVPHRSLNKLKTADLLVFEEDRGARRCLKAAGVFRDYLRYNEHDQKETLDQVRQALKQGKTVCYMSDQGMPTIADPGASLLEIAFQLGTKIEIIPGPSSITAALAACPFLEQGYHYLGFLPRDEHQRRQAIEAMKSNSEPTVLLDTPYRRKALLTSLSEVLGGERRALCAVDISGPLENYYLDTLQRLANLELEKLNFVLIVEGHKKTNTTRKGKQTNFLKKPGNPPRKN